MSGRETRSSQEAHESDLLSCASHVCSESCSRHPHELSTPSREDCTWATSSVFTALLDVTVLFRGYSRTWNKPTVGGRSGSQQPASSVQQCLCTCRSRYPSSTFGNPQVSQRHIREIYESHSTYVCSDEFYSLISSHSSRAEHVKCKEHSYFCWTLCKIIRSVSSLYTQL